MTTWLSRGRGRPDFLTPRRISIREIDASAFAGIGIVWVARISIFSPRLIDCSRQPKTTSTSSSARAQGNLSLSAMTAMRSALVMDMAWLLHPTSVAMFCSPATALASPHSNQRQPCRRAMIPGVSGGDPRDKRSCRSEHQQQHLPSRTERQQTARNLSRFGVPSGGLQIP